MMDLMNHHKKIEDSNKPKQHALKTGKAKLNPEIVKDILKRLGEGEYITSIGKIYNVSHSAISNIKTGRTWNHITGIKPKK